jgi:tRNA(Ile)-lysidine synthetase-like protein
MATTIVDFWRANPAFWFPTTPADKAIADAAIQTRFAAYDFTQDTLTGQVLYLDQFLRHFDRAADLTGPRMRACALVESRLDELLTADELELVFCLMPFKHLGQFDFVFSYLHTVWLRDRPVRDFPLLNRFYNDTYRKAYTYAYVESHIQTSEATAAATTATDAYDPITLCESFPPEYATKGIRRDATAASVDATVLRTLLHPPPDLISLSGGVDSMVMTALAATATVSSADRTPSTAAVHIVYGNREESVQERAFLVEYCQRLGVRLYTFEISWLRRACVEREFYETMTRDLRFMVYRACGATMGKGDAPPRVALGHIRDDVVENVWTNLAKGQHLSNLKKMAPVEEQHGVLVCRPFLTVEKDAIYRVAAAMHVPYLKNTTPAWSNRGKFRTTFHAATHAQFGTAVDGIVLGVADAYAEQARLVDRLLYRPLLASGGEDGVYDITNAVEVDMNEIGWTYCLERMCHARSLPRPGVHAIRDLCTRLRRYATAGVAVDTDIPLKRGVVVRIRGGGGDSSGSGERRWTLCIR